jgi:hypothetical protein
MLGVTLGIFFVASTGIPDLLPVMIIMAIMIAINLVVFGCIIPRRSISKETEKTIILFYLINASVGSFTYFLGLLGVGFIPLTVAFNRISWFLYLSFLNNYLPAFLNENSYENLLIAGAILLNFIVAILNWLVYRTACRKRLQ